MKNIILTLLIIIISIIEVNAQWEEKGDTIIVQTLSYDSITTRSGTWQFPPAGEYEKILMHYSLKCDPRTTRDGFDCGEWDYLTYTVVTDSSGKFDSTRFTSPNFQVRGSTPAKYYFTNQQYNYKELETIYTTSYGDGLVDKEEVVINGGESGIFELDIPNSKAFFINMHFTSEELNDFRDNQGEIHAIKLKFLETATINNFRIRLKNSNISATGAVLNEESDKYLGDITVNKDELKELILFSPHKLESNEGLTIVLSGELEEGKIALQAADNNNLHKAGYYLAGQNYVKFTQGSYIDVPKEAFDNLDREITIAFWQYGDNIKMPQNSHAFEGVNKNGQRVINSHLPWSNGQVYWDAGNSGGSYDRINKQATDSDFKGQWNHWAFTKDVKTGVMKIYLNGEEWLSGESKSNGFDKIEIFKIASNALGNGRYDGSMDNFAVWDRVLSASEINTVKDLDFVTQENTVILNGLLFCYDMNNISNNKVLDVSGNGHDGEIHGFAESRGVKTDIFRIADNRESLARPSITFVKANFSGASSLTRDKEEIYREYPMPMDEVTLFDYESPNSLIPTSEIASFTEMIKVPTGTISVYPANKQIYVYNEIGFVIDSVSAPATDSLVKTDIVYYSPVVDYEIHRFITPYGINLDLGPDGFTWIEDVTDFGPLLQDFVKLRAGNQQELIDLKFLFIKGTPARDVKSVQVMWKEGGNFPNIVKDIHIPTIELTPFEDATMFKALTRSSGHRFGGDPNTDNCAEFCKRTHKLYVGNSEFSWEGWKECGDNPVFPQGGTWDIDRADWCPGASVNNHENELTSLLTPGVAEFVDYEIINPSQFVPFGDYVFTGYLIGYGDANFKTDASIERIISPSIDQEYGRLNPSCFGPELIIKNNGSEDLTSLKIEYGVKDGEMSEYIWDGNLKFLESRKITLPPVYMNNLNQGTKYEFEFRISNPNNTEDEYERNNFAKSEFIGVDVLSSDLTINLKTNNFADQQYQMSIKKADGTIIREVKLGDFESNKNYSFEDELEIGCYELLFENTQGWGLDLWYRRDQLGTGFINLSSGSKNVVFDADFGNFIKYQFSVGTKPEILVTQDTLNFGDHTVGDIQEKSFFIEPANEKGLTLKSVEMGLAKVKGMYLVKPVEITDDIYIPYGEKYELVFSFEPKDDKPKTSTITIKTDADNVPNYRLTLIGNTGISSVEETYDKYFEANVISSNEGNSLEIWNQTGTNENIEINLYDMNGKLLDEIWSGQLGNNRVILPINETTLNSGVYLIKVRANKFNKDLKFINIK